MKLFKFFLSFLFTLLLTLILGAGLALAADPGIPAIDSLSGMIMSHMAIVASVGAVLVEILAKLFPTANPQGWLIWADKLLQKVSAIVSQVGGALKALDGAIASLIPQNVAPPSS